MQIRDCEGVSTVRSLNWHCSFMQCYRTFSCADKWQHQRSFKCNDTNNCGLNLYWCDSCGLDICVAFRNSGSKRGNKTSSCILPGFTQKQTAETREHHVIIKLLLEKRWPKKSLFFFVKIKTAILKLKIRMLPQNINQIGFKSYIFPLVWTCEWMFWGQKHVKLY